MAAARDGRAVPAPLACRGRRRAAIYRLAETGAGELYKFDEDNNVTARLVAGAYHVLLTIDREDGTIRVWRIYRAPA